MSALSPAMLQSVTETVGVFTEGTHKSPHSEALNLGEARPPAPVAPDSCRNSEPHIARCGPWSSLSSTEARSYPAGRVTDISGADIRRDSSGGGNQLVCPALSSRGRHAPRDNRERDRALGVGEGPTPCQGGGRNMRLTLNRRNRVRNGPYSETRGLRATCSAPAGYRSPHEIA